MAEFAVAGVKDAIAKHDGVLGKISALRRGQLWHHVHGQGGVPGGGVRHGGGGGAAAAASAAAAAKSDKKKKGKSAEKAEKAEKAAAADDAREAEAGAALARRRRRPRRSAGRRLLADETLEDSDGDAEVPDAPLPADEPADDDAAAQKKMRERRRVFRTPLTVTEGKRAVAAMSPTRLRSPSAS